MSDNTKKKLGVWIIVILFALYAVSVVAVTMLTDMPLGAVIGYAVVMFAILAVLAYEGWERPSLCQQRSV